MLGTSPHISGHMQEHWYFITEIYCPLCMAGRQYRERRYGPKPKKYTDTHRWIEHWDGCEI